MRSLLYCGLACPGALFLAITASPSSVPPLPPSFSQARVIRTSSAASSSGSLRVVSWNIDRGTHLPEVEDTLRRFGADVLLLQEVDSGTTRTGGRDVSAELARQLGLSQSFAIEFEELSQEQGTPAYTGQATLSRLPVRSARVLRFQHQSDFWHPRSWLPNNVPLLQRRLGDRIALVTELDWGGRLLVVYNLHLESRSYGRIQMQQLDETLADCRSHYPADTPVLLGGDLNSKYLPSHYLKKLESEGFRSATGERIERTHTVVMSLDWLFSRNLPNWENGKVEHSTRGSDHYAITASIPAR